MALNDETVLCWSCPHNVDEHDVLARCGEPTCGCGWTPAIIPKPLRSHSVARLPALRLP